MTHQILDIGELLDIDLKKFERDNSIKLVPAFHNFRESSAKKETSKSHFESVGSSRRTGLVIPKKKVSEYHFNVGLGKRHQQDVSYSDAFTPKASAKKAVLVPAGVRAKLETVQIKKNLFLKYMSDKLKSNNK